MTGKSEIELTEDMKRTLKIIKKRGWTAPTKLGIELGYSYYDSCGQGYKNLQALVFMGLVKKEGEGKGVKYVLTKG